MHLIRQLTPLRRLSFRKVGELVWNTLPTTPRSKVFRHASSPYDFFAYFWDGMRSALLNPSCCVKNGYIRQPMLRLKKSTYNFCPSKRKKSSTDLRENLHGHKFCLASNLQLGEGRQNLRQIKIHLFGFEPMRIFDGLVADRHHEFSVLSLPGEESCSQNLRHVSQTKIKKGVQAEAGKMCVMSLKLN